MKILPFTIVMSLLCAVGCATVARAPRDPFGQWHVAKIHSGTEGRVPARDFVVRFLREGEAGLVRVLLSGMNSHSSSMRVDGEALQTMGISTQTLLGCLRRVDIDGVDGASGKPAPSTENPCLAVEADEELIANVLAAPTSWREHGGMLLVRSNPKDAWIELRR
jgi:hypothetical protein